MTSTPGLEAASIQDVIPKNSGRSYIVRRGQHMRIGGRTVLDFVAFNLHDTRERFDQARTKTNQAKVFISTGDILYSKLNHPMLTIVEDGFVEGHHDLQKGMCSRERFKLIAEGKAKRVFAEGVDLNPQTPADIPDHGCWENLIDGLKDWPIPSEDIPSPFNIFQDMKIDPETGALMDTTVRPAVRAHVEMRAEMDCLVAISTCPQSGRGEEATVEVFDPA
jgi:uncharacterized protein YcgI (DUF1989 family)